MRSLFLFAAATALLLPETSLAQEVRDVDLKEWPVEWGGRVRDPFVAPDGKVWFVGQQGNYIASFDPASDGFRRYEIEDGTHPHNLIVDGDGHVWYAGNRNGRIGRLDPRTGESRIYLTGDARDPHTLVFDGRGNIWFTSQGSNRIGRLRMNSGTVDLVSAANTPSNPYGIIIDGEGNPWVTLFRSNTIVRVDPETMALTPYRKANEASRSRRIEWTPDHGVWYVDEPRGYLGRIDSRTGEVREWATPGGPGSRPYALTRDDQGRLWFSETGPEKRLVGFDPASERFFSVHEVSNTIRHMMFHSDTGTMWYGTDSNRLGRLVTRSTGN